MKSGLASALSAVVERCAELQDLAVAPTATPLPGRSNVNYRIHSVRGDFALRLPHPDAGPFVDRAREIEATRMAGSLGIGPELVHAEDSGVLLTRWIDGQVMSAEAFRSDPNAIGRLGRALARLHRSACRFDRRFDIFLILDSYAQAFRRRGNGGIVWSPRLGGAVAAARAGLARCTVPPVPSHCDLVPENCIDTGSRMFLIDWEYAGMNDPAWDLAYVALEADFSPAQEEALLAAYGGSALSYGRLQVFKLLAAVMNFLWGLGAHPGDLSPDMARWTEEKLSAAEALVRDDRFDGWLAAVEDS